MSHASPRCVRRPVDHTDSILWKLFYVTGCLFVAMQNMEEWEEAVFDKTKNLIELKTFSLYALILTLRRKGQEKGERQQRAAAAVAGSLLSCGVMRVFILPPSPSRVGSDTFARCLRQRGEGSLFREGLPADASAGDGLLLPPHPERHAGGTQVGRRALKSVTMFKFNTLIISLYCD